MRSYWFQRHAPETTQHSWSFVGDIPGRFGGGFIESHEIAKMPRMHFRTHFCERSSTSRVLKAGRASHLGSPESQSILLSEFCEKSGPRNFLSCWRPTIRRIGCFGRYQINQRRLKLTARDEKRKNYSRMPFSACHRSSGKWLNFDTNENIQRLRLLNCSAFRLQLRNPDCRAHERRYDNSPHRARCVESTP